MKPTPIDYAFAATEPDGVTVIDGTTEYLVPLRAKVRMNMRMDDGTTVTRYADPAIVFSDILSPEPLRLPPSNVTVTPLDSTSARVEWTHPGDSVIQFEVFDEGLHSMAKVAATDRAVVLTGLTPDTAYKVFVAAAYSPTASYTSEPVEFKTPKAADSTSGVTDFPTPTPKPGDTILDDGSYPARTFSGRTFARNPGKVFIKGGAKFSANALTVGLIFDGGGKDSQDNSTAMVLIDQPGVQLYDCIARNSAGVGIGIMHTTDPLLVRVIAEHNGRAGIGGTSVDRGHLVDCTSRSNNAKLDPNGGGGKFTRTKSILIEGHEATDNYAAGIWFDYNNINVTLKPSATRPCHLHHNKDGYKGSSLKCGGSGFFGEISGIVDGSSTRGPIRLIDVVAHDNRLGISAGELKASTNEDVNMRSCSNFEIRGGKIDRIVVSGGEGKRTESSDRGGNNIIDGVTCKAPVLSDKRFGDLVGKGLVKITNVKVVS